MKTGVAMCVVRVVLIAALLSACGAASAAARYAVASGAWNQTSPTTIWSATSGGPPGASIPVVGNTVTIGETATPRTVTIPAGYAANAASVTLGSSTQLGPSALTLAASSATLWVSGAVAVSAASNNNTTNTLDVGPGAATIAGGLTVTGGNGNRRAQLSIGTGSASVGGSLGVNNNNVWITFTAGGTLTIGGSFANGATFTRGTGTVEYTGNAAQSAGAYAYHHLTVDKSGGAAAISGRTTVTGNLAVNAGTLNLTGFDFTVAGATSIAGTLAFVTSTAGTKTFAGPVAITGSGNWNNAINEAVTLNGNLTNNGTFAPGTGLYSFSGAARQTITGTPGSATRFGNITLNNANGLALPGGSAHNVIVNTTLTLTAGAVFTNDNVLAIASGSAIGGAGGSNFVVGNLRKPFPVNAASTLRTFEVGTFAGSSRYTPAILIFNNVATAGDVTVSTTAGAHPALGVSGLDTVTPHKLNRYWTVSGGGIAFASYGALFNFAPADVDAGANPLGFVATRYFPAAPAAGAWNPLGSSGNTATWISVAGVSAFGDFAAGEPLAYNAGLGRFNAYDPPPWTRAGAVHGSIRTKVAGTTPGATFSLTVVHLNAAGTARQGMGPATTVTVALVDGSITTGTFANNCWGSWLTAPAIASASVNLAGPQDNATVTFTVPNAYRDVRVRMTGGGQTGCSGDRFAIRPNAIAVSAAHNDWMTSGTAVPLSNGGAAGGEVHKAGQPFTLLARGMNMAGVTTTNYDGSPALRSSVCVLPAGCATGVFAQGPWSGAAGSGVRSAIVSYAEVGTVNVELEDQGYAVVDAADSTTAQRFVPQAGGVALVGRFVPNHFDVTPLVAPVFRTFNANDAACSPGAPPRRTFTYVGEPFGYTITPQATIIARNSTGATTANYRGALWKIGGAGATFKDCTSVPNTCVYTTAFGAAGGTVGETYTYVLDTAATPGWDNGAGKTIPALAVVSSNNDGTGVVSFGANGRLAFQRSASAPAAPFVASIDNRVSVTDNAEGAARIITTGAPALFAAIAFDAPYVPTGQPNKFFYGRLRLQNASGSHLTALPIPLQTQYWNGTAFVTNALDHCTAITSAHVALGNFQKNLGATETSASVGGTFIAGVGTLRLAAPGAGNNGSVDVSVNLTSTAAGASCTAGMPASTPSGLEHLQGAWCGGTYVRDPTARASFGLRRDSDRMIFQRENF